MSTQIKIVSAKGHPQMQIILEKPCFGFTVKKGWNTKKIKRITDTIIQVPIAMSFDFFSLNKDTFGSYFDAQIAEGSLAQYYGFYDLYADQHRYSVELTENFVKLFAEKGDTMIRYEMNITNEATNGLGMRMPEFEHKLYENAFCDSDVGDFTEKEYQCFVNALGEDSGIVNDIKKTIIAKNTSDDDISLIEQEVLRYENRINETIEKFSADIETFKSSLHSGEFDCGFTIIRTTDEDMKTKYNILKKNGIRMTDDVHMNFPDDYMACSKSSHILDFIQKKANNVDINNLYVRTILD